MRIFAVILAVLLVGCSTRQAADKPEIADQFVACCKTHRQPGFQQRIEDLIPQGSPAERFRTLLSHADNVRTQENATIHVYDPGGSLAGGQGLMVFIHVDAKSNTIKKVQWAIAGH